MKTKAKMILSLMMLVSSVYAGEQIGSVDTSFKLIGDNHKIVVDVFDDPKVEGVSCYISHAKTGGIAGSLGLAEDKSEMSIACRQVGDISFKESLKKQEEVFNESLSFLFKKLKVIRMVDNKKNVLIYLTVSEKLVDGSPQNSITAVPINKSIPLK
jgi:CreA protein